MSKILNKKERLKLPRRKTQEEFEKEVNDIFQGEYQVLGQYINNRTPILIKHMICGNEFEKNPKDMISKHSGCPYCNGNKQKLYNEQWVIDNTPLPYHYIKGYTKMSEKCVFYCDNCNTTFYQKPSRLINKHIYGCNCQSTKKKTMGQFLEELGEETLKEYTVNEDYINSDTKISFTHIPCQTTFSLTPYAFLHKYHKQYCPVCYYKKSKGEIILDKVLTKYSIQHYREYTFQDFPRRRFDFYLPSLNVCIEFDGKQHFQTNTFFSDPDLPKRDLEKNNYCIAKNIDLYRIPYTDIDNIDKIIFDIFKEKSSETIEKYKIY